MKKRRTKSKPRLDHREMRIGALENRLSALEAHLDKRIRPLELKLPLLATVAVVGGLETELKDLIDDVHTKCAGVNNFTDHLKGRIDKLERHIPQLGGSLFRAQLSKLLADVAPAEQLQVLGEAIEAARGKLLVDHQRALAEGDHR